jgi:TonB family protein
MKKILIRGRKTQCLFLIIFNLVFISSKISAGNLNVFCVEFVNATDTIPGLQNEEIVYKKADIMPRFYKAECEILASDPLKEECSKKALLKFIYDQIEYPEVALRSGLEGNTVVQFIVRRSGMVTDINIVRELGLGCGEETKRVIELMTANNHFWVPGVKDGRPVDVSYTLPIRFAIKKDTKIKKIEPEDKIHDDPELPARLYISECESIEKIKDKTVCADNKMMEFIYDNLQYPARSKENKTEGTVEVSFVVRKNGTISDIFVESGVDNYIDKEAERLLGLLNKENMLWKPAMHEGKLVNSQYVVEIDFYLE